VSEAAGAGVGGVFLIPVGTLCVGVVLALVLAVLKPGCFGRPSETWPGERAAVSCEHERIVE
jgi:hypothetical protein